MVGGRTEVGGFTDLGLGPQGHFEVLQGLRQAGGVVAVDLEVRAPEEVVLSSTMVSSFATSTVTSLGSPLLLPSGAIQLPGPLRTSDSG